MCGDERLCDLCMFTCADCGKAVCGKETFNKTGHHSGRVGAGAAVNTENWGPPQLTNLDGDSYVRRPGSARLVEFTGQLREPCCALNRWGRYDAPSNRRGTCAGTGNRQWRSRLSRRWPCPRCIRLRSYHRAPTVLPAPTPPWTDRCRNCADPGSAEPVAARAKQRRKFEAAVDAASDGRW